MAATVEARRLTEAHRLAQARIGAQTVQQMLAAWPLLDPSDLDGTFQRWLRVVYPLIEAQRSTSARLAANYLITYRSLELGVAASPVTPTLAAPAAPEAVSTSMLVTGPASIRSAVAAGTQFARAVDTARNTAARAGLRHALAGGRDTITGTVARDRQAHGWARATSGNPCAFCAMLASRGPVYREQSSADFQAHDGCSCGAEPIYRRDGEWPSGARQYQELWQQSTRGTSGDDAINAFRQALAGEGDT